MRPSCLVLRICLAMGLTTGGCAVNRDKFEFCAPADINACNQPAVGVTQLASTDANLCPDRDPMYAEPVSPLDIDETMLTSDRLLPMSLEDCIRQALETSHIMRDLGGTVVRSPQTIGTNLDPALIYSDPRLGEEAALSAFDANFFVNNYFERNDRAFNNPFFGRLGNLQQDLNTTQTGINKRSATGGLYTLRNISVFDRNNQSSNRFPYSWDTFVEAEMRQPLLQGAGTEFNRIAGPGATPGQLNGVLLARVRTDVTLTDFERSVRDLVAEVENAYWDLYYSYRDLEARIAVRDIAEETSRQLSEAATPIGKRAQAEEQVHRFQSEVVDSINGRPIDGTRTNNGSAAGTFRSNGGLRISERKLRLMIGLPINDGRLIRPMDTPSMAPVVYDWNSCIADALQMREELRRQRWVIKQRELELVANRNFLKPQLDVVSRYRFRGFGEDLLGPNSATASLYDGQFQEWQAGVEYNMPVGFRRAHAAVQNSRLALAREVEVLREQERFVHFGLSNAINESKRAYENLALQRKRLDAIVTQLNAIDARDDAEKAELDVRLETHRRLLDARLRYHQAEVEYALALRNVNFEKGSLLTYCNVSLAESMPNPKAQMDAAERIQFRDFDKQPRVRDQVIGKPGVRGPRAGNVEASTIPGLPEGAVIISEQVVPTEAGAAPAQSTVAPPVQDAPSTEPPVNVVPVPDFTPEGKAPVQSAGPGGSVSVPLLPLVPVTQSEPQSPPLVQGSLLPIGLR